MDTNDFIFKAEFVHKSRYDYAYTIYKNSRSKVSIICTKHGVFEQLAKNHLAGQGCPNCKVEKLKKQFSGKDCFVEKAIKVHGE